MNVHTPSSYLISLVLHFHSTAHMHTSTMDSARQAETHTHTKENTFLSLM